MGDRLLLEIDERADQTVVRSKTCSCLTWITEGAGAYSGPASTRSPPDQEGWVRPAGALDVSLSRAVPHYAEPTDLVDAVVPAGEEDETGLVGVEVALDLPDRRGRPGSGRGRLERVRWAIGDGLERVAPLRPTQSSGSPTGIRHRQPGLRVVRRRWREPLRDQVP